MMIGNNERVICQGFHVLRFKERLDELGNTSGFYNFMGLGQLRKEVYELEGYTASMEKRLFVLEENIISPCLPVVCVDPAMVEDFTVTINYIASNDI